LADSVLDLVLGLGWLIYLWVFMHFCFQSLFLLSFCFSICLLIFWVVGFDLKAITLCPNVPVYWTNRALCHRKRKYVRSLTLFGFTPLSLANFFFSPIALELLISLCFNFTLSLGCSYYLCSDWPKVEEDCRRAIELNNNSVKVWNLFI